jgi:hypothetical protein
MNLFLIILSALVTKDIITVLFREFIKAVIKSVQEDRAERALWRQSQQPASPPGNSVRPPAPQRGNETVNQIPQRRNYQG